MKLSCLIALTFAAAAQASSFHVAIQGSDANSGSKNAPFRTIQHAADQAQPGDVVIVRKGIYRELINPPRGGTSDKKRIVYEAEQGEKVVITGSEIVKNWEHVTNDTWRVTTPNSFFDKFNPYSDGIHGDWFAPLHRAHHTGCVYLNGEWLIEAAGFSDVLKAAAKTSLWYAAVDGVTVEAAKPEYLANIVSLKPAGGSLVPATSNAARLGTQVADCAEGGQCVGFIRPNDWLRFDDVDFGTGTESVALRTAASPGAGGDVELRLDEPDGELLGICEVPVTGGWQKWQSITAKIRKTEGKKKLCLVFKAHKTSEAEAAIKPPPNSTLIYAQFPGVNPNDSMVEINVRRTVFTPERTGVNYITVRGFDLRNAATAWAPPTAGQIGIISAYWSKGWIIEENEISHSKCCGIALGRYSDEWDNRAESAEGYIGTLTRALSNGWNKATVGSHVVRNNHIHHCEQTGVVGSLGCSFSSVTGNVIHDIHVHQLFGGAEMAGIKFHGAIDVIISHNHIYRCGNVSGIWLDWMAQGAQVTGNLMHDNTGALGDLFFEMQHGPLMVANNILLSQRMSFALNAQGIAFAQNLITGPINNMRSDPRSTPFHPAHSTEVAGRYPAPSGDSGDHRFYNNLFVGPCNLHALDASVLPCFAAGNVFTRGSQPSKFDRDRLLKPDFDADVTLTEKPDGWYLALKEAKSWSSEVKRKLVTTDFLAKAKVPNCSYENPDGSSLRVNTDYFGNKRDEHNPFPGPFEIHADGLQKFKVWPVKRTALPNH